MINNSILLKIPLYINFVLIDGEFYNQWFEPANFR